MTDAKILAIDIERQSALVDGVWEGKQYGSWIAPERVIEPPRTICFAYRWIDDPDHKTQFVAEWDGNLPQDNQSHTPGGGHQNMVEQAWDLLSTADYVVGYNSKNFDVKHLNTAFWYYDLTPPAPHVDIDLMKEIARNFNPYAKSMRYVAKAKAMEGKENTENGLWRTLRFGQGDVLRRAQRSMKRYNVRDVDQTVELYYDTRPWLRGMNLGLWAEDGEMHCTNCNSTHITKQGKRPNSTRMYQRFQCQACGKWLKDVHSIQAIDVTGI